MGQGPTLESGGAGLPWWEELRAGGGKTVRGVYLCVNVSVRGSPEGTHGTQRNGEKVSISET